MIGVLVLELVFPLSDEIRWGESDLASARNAVAALFRLESSRQPEEVRAVLHDLVGWLRAPEQTSLRRDFTVWFARTFLPGRAPGHSFPEFNDLQEVDAMLSETVMEWTKKWKEEGLAEGFTKGEASGLTKGEARGRAEVAQRLLARHMSMAEVAELTGLSVAEVEALRRS